MPNKTTVILSITFYNQSYFHIRAYSTKICHISELVVCKDAIYFALLLKACISMYSLHYYHIIEIKLFWIACLNKE